jgi:large subunit ribosomal protein L31e
MADEKILTINLRKNILKVAKWRRGKCYSKIFQELVKNQLKTDKIKVDKKVNERIWRKGIENPPTKLRIKSVKQNDGITRIELME